MKARRNRQHKRLFRRRTAPGAPPGTLVADPTAPKPVVRLIAYSPEGVLERELTSPGDFDQIPQVLKQYAVTWLNVDGLGDADVVLRIGRLFHLHPLALEDVLN